MIRPQSCFFSIAGDYAKPVQIIGLLLMIAAAGLISGCQSTGNNNMDLGDVLNHFQASGIEMQLIQEADAPFMDSAMSVQVAGREIGIYKYNINIQKQKQRLDMVKENGHMARGALFYPALVNGSFVMIGYEKNPAKHQLSRAFESFSKKNTLK